MVHPTLSTFTVVALVLHVIGGYCFQHRFASMHNSIENNRAARLRLLVDPTGVNQTSNGGWGEDVLPLGPLNRECTIKAVSLAEIQTGKVNMSHPFRVVGAMPWLVQSTSVGSFLQRYGSTHLRTTGTVLGVRGFPSRDSPSVLVREYVQELLAARNLRTVIWDELAEPVTASLSLPETTVEPHPVRDLRKDGRSLGFDSGLPVVPDTREAAGPADRHDSFILAGSGTGTYIHQHGDTMTALGWGRKYWVMLPGNGLPGALPQEDVAMLQSLYPADTIEMFTGEGAQFANSDYQVCTQEAGDIIHIPTNWLHVTLNHWPTASITLQAGYDPSTAA